MARYKATAERQIPPEEEDPLSRMREEEDNAVRQGE